MINRKLPEEFSVIETESFGCMARSLGVNIMSGTNCPVNNIYSVATKPDA
jgi:hypothetical protein